MKSVFVKTVTGKDKANIVKSLAEVTRSLGGEWLKSKLIRMAPQFSAMMLVSIDEEKEAELKTALEEAFPDLAFSYASADAVVEGQGIVATVVIDCDDRPGLTHDINGILSDLNLKTESMESHRLPVALLGRTVYTAKMTVLFPDDSIKEQLVENLESLSERARVNFE